MIEFFGPLRTTRFTPLQFSSIQLINHAYFSPRCSLLLSCHGSRRASRGSRGSRCRGNQVLIQLLRTDPSLASSSSSDKKNKSADSVPSCTARASIRRTAGLIFPSQDFVREVSQRFIAYARLSIPLSNGFRPIVLILDISPFRFDFPLIPNRTQLFFSYIWLWRNPRHSNLFFHVCLFLTRSRL